MRIEFNAFRFPNPAAKVANPSLARRIDCRVSKKKRTATRILAVH
jgi:hypothetical protein